MRRIRKKMSSIKSLICIFAIFASIASAMAAKKMIHPNVKICKRNDPKLSECFKANFERLLPQMKYGIPEMNIVPIEPVHVEHVQLTFPQAQSVQLTATLDDMKLSGISGTTVNEIAVTHNAGAYVMYVDMIIPRISMISNYKAVGKLLLLAINAQGDFTGNFEGLHVKSNWTSTSFRKKEREHLSWETEIKELTMKKMSIQFNNLFGNNTELTENTNKVINENIDALYDEISPVVKETVSSVAKNAVNNVYGLFPLDVLFPKD